MFFNNLPGDLLTDKILNENNTNTKTCLVYQPFLGDVEDMEGLDIKSEKFEITDNEALILNGNVVIDFPDGILEAGKARVDRKNGTVEFKKEGDLFLKDYFFRAKEGFFNEKDRSLELYSGEAYLNDRNLILAFDELKGNLEDKIILKQVSMTSCADPKRGWQFIAESIELDDQSKRGNAKKVKVKALDRTILRLPYIPFATSNERMTGFLEPSLSYSSDGLEFMIPYFKVISGKSDITLAARNISDRGLGFEGNFRKLHGKENNLSNFDFIYFKEDKEFNTLYPEQSKKRWAFSIKDSYGQKEKFWVDVNWSKTSDSLVLRDIPGDITSIGDQRAQNLMQNISINAAINNLSIKLEHQGFQVLNPILTNGYKKLPSIEFKYLKNFENFTLYEKLNISYFKADSIHGFYGYQDKNNQFLYRTENPIEGSRIFSNFKILNQTYFNGLNINSSLGVKSIHYNLDDGAQSNSVNVPNFKLDISTLFYRKDKMNLHVLKPRFIYGYVAHKDQDINPIFDTNKISMMNQLFNNQRFTGMDRIGDQNFYTLSLEYKKRNMGMDKFAVNISKKFYLDDREIWLDDMHLDMDSMNNEMMNMNMSHMNMMQMPMDEGPIMLMAKWMPNMNTMFMAYSSYLHDQDKVPMAGITFNQNFEKGTLGYAKRYTRMTGDFMTVLDYSEFYADLKIKDNISFIAKFKRDDESSSKIESVFGLGYENCCFVFRITSSDKNLSKYLPILESNSQMYLNNTWDNIIRIENKSRINFQFEFKGLNSSFEKINRLMNNSIFNY
jgi:LPS-assembly protein|tara:strand:+ start:2716 stop:5064 length:2349 start_codon:yes stop_codon:yes gene_type:complete